MEEREIPLGQGASEAQSISESDPAQVAREFFRSFYGTDWRGKRRTKEYRDVIGKVVELEQQFPEVWDEILEERDLDVDEWRDFRRFISRHSKDLGGSE